MPKKAKKVPKKAKKSEPFTFRVKLGEYEIEIKGTHENVTNTIEKLPKLITNVHKAFDSLTPKTVTTLTVKTEPTESKTKSKKTSQEYPKITSSKSGEDAILRILNTNWGKWRPRTMEELQDAAKSNDLKYSKTILTKAVSKLVKKGKVRRWSTNAGFVYILAEEKPAHKGGKKK
jgi:uncharacterized membrane protein